MNVIGKDTRPRKRARMGSQACLSLGATVVLMSGLLTLAAPALAQTPQTVNVAIDATVAGAPIERVWPFFGYDEINYTTQPEGRALLSTLVAANTAPLHVRSHFLFNTGDGTPAMKWGSTNVYTEDPSGNPIYSWPLTDGILDTITSVGAFPFVELAFMPQALSSHPTPYRNAGVTTLDSGCFYPPNDYSKWAELIRTWGTHANERYPDVAATWLWELWNEPDIGYWHGTFDEYAKLFDYTESALHTAIPNAALGGPAVVRADGDFLTKFLQHCATGTNAVSGQTGTRLDIVTFHAKGGVAMNGGQVEMDLGNQLRIHRTGFDTVASFSQFKQTPIYITEADPDGCAACPAKYLPANAYRNSTAYGAYEIAMMKHTLELENQAGVKLGGLLTWAFTFPDTPYFAGYRALATHGINLPVLSAFKLLGQLKGKRAPLSSSGAIALDDILTSGVRGQPEIDGMATVDGAKVQALVWNYHDDIVPVDPTLVHLAIKVPASFGSNVIASHLRVDETHGDAYTVWVAQGMPANPSASQISELQQAMEPASLLAGTILTVANGSVSVDFQLPRFAVSLITIQPEADGQSVGSTQTTGLAGGGCACGVLRRGSDRLSTAALFGMGGVLALALVTRRRNAITRCAKRH